GGSHPCAVCGRPRSDPAQPCANAWCGRADRGFSVVFSIGDHAGPLRRAIVAYKYHGERWWAEVFARLLAGGLMRNAPWFEEFSLLVPVPAFGGTDARRRWDPVGRMTALLDGRLVGWELAPAAVVKLEETEPLAGRSRAERVRVARTALRRALAVPDPAVVRDRRVLVLDDVFTEGATLREVALALRRAGAIEVAGLVLARAVPRP
ncbi:MAG: ComF family protein, partial [Acidimicrobiales bacterium]